MHFEVKSGPLAPTAQAHVRTPHDPIYRLFWDYGGIAARRFVPWVKPRQGVAMRQVFSLSVDPPQPRG